jgi:hypothetical protein
MSASQGLDTMTEQLLSCMQERSVGVIGVCLFLVALQLCHLGQQRRVDHLGHVTGGLGLLNDPHDLVHGLRRLGGIRDLVVGLLPLRDLPREVLQEPRVMLYLRDRGPLSVSVHRKYPKYTQVWIIILYKSQSEQ